MLLSAGIGIATAGEQESGDQESLPAKTLYVPKIDPKQARQSAINYLVSLGVPPDQARLRIQKQSRQVRAATALRKRAPESVQSVWIDDSGTLMATVLNDDGERAARAAGVTPIFAPRAAADLEAARDTLVKEAMDNPPPGFSGAMFEIDSAGGKLIVRYLFNANPVVPKAVAQFGDMVTASAEVGSLDTMDNVDIIGTSMESETGSFCTASWPVDIADPNGGAPGNGVMTAGHCFNNGDPAEISYDIDTSAIGNTKATGEFFHIGDEGDYGYLRLERDRGTTRFITSPHVIEAIEEPVVGVTACKDGAVSDVTCGTIEATDITTIVPANGVGYVVKRQVHADFCNVKGDSGAPVYMDYDQAKGPDGIAGLGVLSSAFTGPGGTCQTLFTPLSGIDNQNKFYVRIDGG